MSDLGTIVVLGFSRALGWIDFRYPAVRPLRAITASTDFDGSTGRVPGSIDPKASPLNVQRYWNINQFPICPLRITGGLRID